MRSLLLSVALGLGALGVIGATPSRADASWLSQALHARYDPYYYGPHYLAVYDENDTYFWDWRGEGEARAVLTYRRGDKEFRHDFLFRRQKM